jgi:hypothetical protein
LFLTREHRYVTVAELNCLFAMAVHRITYTPIADIVDYYKEICTLSGPIECTSLVTSIALNIGCPEVDNKAYIERGSMYLSLVFLTLCMPDYFISMLSGGSNKVLVLPNQAYLLCSCDQLIVQLNTMENSP